MQAIIMAAGKGSRLGKASEGVPKSFIKIKGKRLIDYNLDMLRKYGINDITIVTGFMSEEFERELADREGIRFAFNPFYDTTNVLPSFWFGQENLEKDFIYMHADTLCDTDIFEELLGSTGDIVLPVEYGSTNEEAMKVKLINGEVKLINKTMDSKFADGEFIGIAKITKRCIPDIKRISNQIMRAQKFTSFFEVALQHIIDEGIHKVTTIPTYGRFWCEIDFIEDYEEAQKNISENLLMLKG